MTSTVSCELLIVSDFQVISFKYMVCIIFIVSSISDINIDVILYSIDIIIIFINIDVMLILIYLLFHQYQISILINIDVILVLIYLFFYQYHISILINIDPILVFIKIDAIQLGPYK